jgi:hypothetical protein
MVNLRRSEGLFVTVSLTGVKLSVNGRTGLDRDQACTASRFLTGTGKSTSGRLTRTANGFVQDAGSGWVAHIHRGSRPCRRRLICVKAGPHA